MKEMKVEQIAKAIGASVPNGLSGIVSEVAIDSRAAGPGCVFFAIKGDNFDGHDYIEQALDNGAVCAVSSRQADGDLDRVLIVDDTIEALGALANHYRNECGFKVVAITGSAGKTSTRQIAFHALNKFFKSYQAQKSFNNNIGLPLTILGADADCEIVVTEMGTNNPGEIEPLSLIAEPDVALVNNIFAAHLEGLKSIEGITAEKASIAAGLKSCGKFLINGDFPTLVEFCKNNHPEFVTFGTTKGCDIAASNLASTGTSGELVVDGELVNVPLPGRGNLANAVAAFAICKQFGIDAARFAGAMESLSPITMRMEIESFGDVTIINDCYNANPASMQNAVHTLVEMADGKNRRSVFICGHMAELGEHAEQLHRQLGEKVGRSGIEMLITTGPFAEIVAETARASSDNATVASTFENTNNLCENLNNLLLPDDIILVKGSRSAKLEAATQKIAKIFKK